jgi:hypothetical protein
MPKAKSRIRILYIGVGQYWSVKARHFRLPFLALIYTTFRKNKKKLIALFLQLFRLWFVE